MAKKPYKNTLEGMCEYVGGGHTMFIVPRKYDNVAIVNYRYLREIEKQLAKIEKIINS